MNHLFRVPFWISPVASAAATEPAGYSPPIPIPAGVSLVYAEGRERTEEEAADGEHDEDAVGGATTVRAGAEGRKDDEEDGGGGHGKLARVVVGDPAKGQLADDGAGEGDRGDVPGGARVFVVFRVDD